MSDAAKDAFKVGFLTRCAEEGLTGELIGARLEALEKQGKLRGVDQDEKESWAEYIFGIAQPNVRVGKMGSRCMPL